MHESLVEANDMSLEYELSKIGRYMSEERINVINDSVAGGDAHLKIKRQAVSQELIGKRFQACMPAKNHQENHVRAADILIKEEESKESMGPGSDNSS